MTCPRCERTPLHELDRDGITIDRCERCRGVWLDRGELEQLIARGRADDDERAGRRRHDDDDEDDDRGRGRLRRGSWWEIFD